MATIAMAMASKCAMMTATMWQATKRATARAGRAMMMATKRAMANSSKGNGNSDEEGKGG